MQITYVIYSATILHQIARGVPRTQEGDEAEAPPEMPSQIIPAEIF